MQLWNGLEFNVMEQVIFPIIKVLLISISGTVGGAVTFCSYWIILCLSLNQTNRPLGISV